MYEGGLPLYLEKEGVAACNAVFSYFPYYLQIWVVGEYSGCTDLTPTHSDVILKYHEVSGAILCATDSQHNETQCTCTGHALTPDFKIT